MTDWTKIPEKGMMYALYRSHMVYEPYTVEKLRLKKFDFEKEDLLELHLFDREREYRMIRSDVRGLVDYGVISDDTLAFDDIYEETVYVCGKDPDKQDGFQNRIGVVNYITYDEDDLLRIHNYRLKEAEP